MYVVLLIYCPLLVKNVYNAEYLSATSTGENGNHDIYSIIYRIKQFFSNEFK